MMVAVEVVVTETVLVEVVIVLVMHNIENIPEKCETGVNIMKTLFFSLFFVHLSLAVFPSPVRFRAFASSPSFKALESTVSIDIQVNK